MQTEKLSDVLRQIIYQRQNTKNRKLFLEATKDLKPASCKVKIGWRSGSAIAFNCIFEKNGDGDVLTEIEKGVENANEIVYFIYGLNPKIFHFYPDMVFDELKPNIFYFRFKLKKDKTIEG